MPMVEIKPASCGRRVSAHRLLVAFLRQPPSTSPAFGHLPGIKNSQIVPKVAQGAD
jgi:hypothetical protein